MLADDEDLVHHLLRLHLDAGVLVSPDQPADLTNKLPYLVARRVAGAARHPRMLGAPVFDLQAYATTRRAAKDLCRDACLVLFTAADRQEVTPYGHVARYDEASGPVPLPSEVNGVWRFQASVSLLVRPPA